MDQHRDEKNQSMTDEGGALRDWWSKCVEILLRFDSGRHVHVRTIRISSMMS